MLQMTEKEMKKLNTIKKILGGECTKKEAVENLGITTRQIDRLILKYKNDGDAGFIHKSRGKESKKKISENIKEEIVNLYITEYFDYNFTHFYEEIREKYQLSPKSIDNILNEGEIISFSRNTSCTLIVAYDYTHWGYIEDKLYILSEIKSPEKKIYQKTTKTIEEINRSKAHKPAPNHPWRNYKKN